MPIVKGCLVRYDYDLSASHGDVYLAISDPYISVGETWVDVLSEGKKVSLFRERLEWVTY